MKGPGTMNKKYRLVFLGTVESDEVFRQRIYRFGFPPERIEEIINRAPVVIRKDLTLADARQFADVLQQAGGRVSIQEYGLFEESNQPVRSLGIKQLADFTMCPQCGHKQLKQRACVRCGFVLEEQRGRPRQRDDRRR